MSGLYTMVGDTTEGYGNIDREIFKLGRATLPLAFFLARGGRVTPQLNPRLAE